MFLDKLWLRIKGRLLLLREDLAGEGDLRDRALDFLEKLERRLDAPDFKADSGADPATRLDAVAGRMEESARKARTGADREYRRGKSPEPPSLEELERAWEELKRLREKQGKESSDRETPPPNPRKLG